MWLVFYGPVSALCKICVPQPRGHPRAGAGIARRQPRLTRSTRSSSARWSWTAGASPHGSSPKTASSTVRGAAPAAAAGPDPGRPRHRRRSAPPVTPRRRAAAGELLGHLSGGHRHPRPRRLADAGTYRRRPARAGARRPGDPPSPSGARSVHRRTSARGSARAAAPHETPVRASRRRPLGLQPGRAASTRRPAARGHRPDHGPGPRAAGRGARRARAGRVLPGPPADAAPTTYRTRSVCAPPSSGAGSWGTAFAKVLADAGRDVTLWAPPARSWPPRSAETGTNPDYLPGVALPPARSGPPRRRRGAGRAPSSSCSRCRRSACGTTWRAGPPLPDRTPRCVSLMKGVELGTAKRMSEVIAEVAGVRRRTRSRSCPGPNLAREIAAEAADRHGGRLHRPRPRRAAAAGLPSRRYFRPVHQHRRRRLRARRRGQERHRAGRAAWPSGMGFGDNTRASLITRGLAETARLGVALGADPLTFAGLAGLGDLVATCSSPLSRNRTFGERLGRGETLEQAQAADPAGRRGREVLPVGAASWPARTASSCRSPRPSRGSATRASPRRDGQGADLPRGAAASQRLPETADHPLRAGRWRGRAASVRRCSPARAVARPFHLGLRRRPAPDRLLRPPGQPDLARSSRPSATSTAASAWSSPPAWPRSPPCCGCARARSCCPRTATT